MPPDLIERQLKNAAIAFPDAMVENYESLIDGVNLKDPNDRHVVAAALKVNANVIVTNNLKHFQLKYLETLNLDVKSPDDFLCDAIDLDINHSLQAFREMCTKYKNPPLEETEVLEGLKSRGLIKTSSYLYSQL